MPFTIVLATVGNYGALLKAAPSSAVISALAFGFAFGFGAIMFGLSVDRLGISLANSLTLGISSALGSLIPLFLKGDLRVEPRQEVLFLGVFTFLFGVWLCAKAGSLRERGKANAKSVLSGRIVVGFLFAISAGILNAILNTGYALAQPIGEAGERLGYPRFYATNVIWLLMLGAASIPNIAFCVYLLARNRTAALFGDKGSTKAWGLSVVMGLLWGASLFVYGAATPLLGDIGPSIGWPTSLAVGLLVVNGMGVLLGEWKGAGQRAMRYMSCGIAALITATVLCAISTTFRAG